MFTVALFTVAKIRKQHVSINRQMDIEDVPYVYTCIYTMNYHSVIKKNEFSSLATTWMDLEGIMLSEISQTEKD